MTIYCLKAIDHSNKRSSKACSIIVDESIRPSCRHWCWCSISMLSISDLILYATAIARFFYNANGCYIICAWAQHIFSQCAFVKGHILSTRSFSGTLQYMFGIYFHRLRSRMWDTKLSFSLILKSNLSL